ncbi:MAG: hypothetical protein AVDCRST_MAG73-773, partial [uncultured Thermomicrobiales bacterium]
EVHGAVVPRPRHGRLRGGGRRVAELRVLRLHHGRSVGDGQGSGGHPPRPDGGSGRRDRGGNRGGGGRRDRHRSARRSADPCRV